MRQIRDKLEKRKGLVEETIARAESEIRTCAADGRLKILKRGKALQYQVCHPDGKIQYISRKNSDDIKSIAQRGYLKKLLNVAKKELLYINRCLKQFPTVYTDSALVQNPNRRELIEPYFETDEEYIKRWIEKPYERKGFKEGEPEFWTEKGERVRSKSEVLIANKLYKLGIPYVYEYPIRLSSGMVVYPDFKILDVENRKDIIHEHFGRMDDPLYISSNFMKKIRAYEKSGIYIGDRLIVTFESGDMPFNDKMYEKQLRAMGLV